VTGCGGSDSTQVIQQVAQQANISLGAIQVRSVLARTVPTNVTHMRFLGFNQNGYGIYGPVTVVKTAVIDLPNVPVDVKTLLVTYLQGDLPVGAAIVPVTVVQGQTTTLTDIPFTDVVYPAGPTGPTGATGANGQIPN